MKLDIRGRFNMLKLIHHRIYVLGDYDNCIFTPTNILTRSNVSPVCIMPTPWNAKFRKSFVYMAHLLWLIWLISYGSSLRGIQNPLCFKRLLKTFVMQFN